MGLTFIERSLVGIYILSFCFIIIDSTTAQNTTKAKQIVPEGNGQTFLQLYNYQANKRNTHSLIEVNPPSVPADGPPIAIVNCRLINGLGGDPIENAAVVIEGNRIVDAGMREEVNIPVNTDHFDAKGKTLIPGLIDAHFHSIMDNKRLNRYLQHGITTMRDPGHPFRFYQSLYFAEIPVPRMFLTGAHLDGFPPAWPQQAIVIKNAKQARQIVYDHIKNGASGIKIYFRLPLKYYEVITSTASRLGVPVVAHLELIDADAAIRAGVDGIEHVTSFGTAIADLEDAKAFKEAVSADPDARRVERYKLWAKINMNSERVQDVIDLAVKNNIFIPLLLIHCLNPSFNSFK